MPPKSQRQSQSQATQKAPKLSQSMRRSTLYDLSDLKKQEFIGNCVNYILMAMNKNDAIKKADLVKYALEEEGKALGMIWPDVVKTLYDIFGFVVYSDNFDEEGNQIKAVPDKFFVKYEDNDFNLTGRLRKKNGPPEQAFKDCLLVQVLSVIFMKGDACPEDMLLKFGERLGVDVYFQDYKKVISDEFCRGQYLFKEISEAEPPITTYRWGFRAEAEVSKKSLLDYICNLYKKKPEDFREQMAQIEEQVQYWDNLTRHARGESSGDEED